MMVNDAFASREGEVTELEKEKEREGMRKMHGSERFGAVLPLIACGFYRYVKAGFSG